MAYLKGFSIIHDDYNTLLAGSADGTPSHDVPNITALIGIGYGIHGYGQTIVPTAVTINDKISASSWSYIVNTITNIGVHQATALSPMTGTILGVTYSLPTAGTKVKALPNVQLNLTNLFTNNLNAVAQGTAVNYPNTYSAAWKNQISFTHTVYFASADQARYFFNAGGQIKLSFAHPSGGTGDALKINTLFTNLCSQNNGIGQLYISAPASGTALIKTKTFTGLTRGAGTTIPAVGLPTPSLFNQNSGYYAIPLVSTPVFSLAGGNLATPDRLSGYNNSAVTINTLTNGPTGLNGDNGSILTINTTYTQTPDTGYSRLIATAGAAVTLSVIPPSTAKIANTWGTITVTTSSTGS